MTASTLLLTWFNNQTSVQAQGSMVAISYAMPVVFMFILNSLPAGLNYYYLLSNIASIIQQVLIRRSINEEELHRKLQDNKIKNANKPKTGFAKRLEDAMKSAEDLQKQQKKSKKK
jgi:YidC/Oxa1 family membrane protein insertase